MGGTTRGCQAMCVAVCSVLCAALFVGHSSAWHAHLEEVFASAGHKSQVLATTWASHAVCCSVDHFSAWHYPEAVFASDRHSMGTACRRSRHSMGRHGNKHHDCISKGVCHWEAPLAHPCRFVCVPRFCSRPFILQVDMGNMDDYECPFEERMWYNRRPYHTLMYPAPVPRFPPFSCRWAWATWTTMRGTLRR
jgi:hypothetical protein